MYLPTLKMPWLRLGSSASSLGTMLAISILQPKAFATNPASAASHLEGLLRAIVRLAVWASPMSACVIASAVNPCLLMSAWAWRMAVAASLGLSEVARAKHFLILARIFGSSSELLKGGLSSGGGRRYVYGDRPSLRTVGRGTSWRLALVVCGASRGH